MAVDKRWHKNRLPHRTLMRGNRGRDVERFQEGLRERLKHIPNGNTYPVTVDGVFGDQTLRAWRIVRYYIGLPANHRPTRRAQLNVRRPWTRSRDARKRAKHRRSTVISHGRTVALEWARDQIGTKENPPGSNSGPKITQWIETNGGRRGWSWCQYFANEVAVQGGAVRVRDGYTVNFLAGRYKHVGYIPIRYADADPGDFIYFKFPGVSGDICDHVAVLEDRDPYSDIEANTNPTNAGSQNNGGGVWRRYGERVPYIVGAVRVPYRA